MCSKEEEHENINCIGDTHCFGTIFIMSSSKVSLNVTALPADGCSADIESTAAVRPDYHCEKFKMSRLHSDSTVMES